MRHLFAKCIIPLSLVAIVLAACQRATEVSVPTVDDAEPPAAEDMTDNLGCREGLFCGEVQVQCVTEPCPPVLQEFASDCEAEQFGVIDYWEGPCETGNANTFVTEEVAYAEDAVGYLAKPVGEGPHPAVVLIHEWWGLNDNIRWYTEEFAKQGYVALAIDMYNGQSTEDPNEARVLASEVRSDIGAAMDHLQSAVNYVKGRSDVQSESLASVGWCFGGGWSYEMAKNNLGTTASVIYYGRFNPEDDLQQMRSTIMGHFGEDDRSIPVDDVKAFHATLQTLNGEHEVFIYENMGHGFARELDNDSAKKAWERTLEFLENQL